jgi:hypothetical protein
VDGFLNPLLFNVMWIECLLSGGIEKLYISRVKRAVGGPRMADRSDSSGHPIQCCICKLKNRSALFLLQRLPHPVLQNELQIEEPKRTVPPPAVAASSSTE